MNKVIDNKKGATAVEFALVLPLLVLLLFGIIEFGLALFNKQIITNASREGARAGIVAGLNRANSEHETESVTVATTYCSNYLVTFSNNPSPLTITPSSTGTSFGDELTVDVQYLYDFLVLSSFGFGPITLRAETTMKLE